MQLFPIINYGISVMGEVKLVPFEIKVPRALRNYAKIPNVHEEFRKHIDASSCEYLPEEGVLKITSSTPEITKKRIEILKEMHFCFLSEKVKLENRLEDNYTEQFEVLEHLLGLTIGKHGSNITKARNIKNVTKVTHIPNTCQIHVEGKTKEAVLAARSILEYTEKRIEVPLQLADKICENDGKIIDEIVEKCGLTRIEVGEDDDFELQSDFESILLVGTADSVSDAEAVLKFRLALLEKQTDVKTDSIETKITDREKKTQISPFCEKFAIRKDLVGLAIGKNGCNIRKAETMEGIDRVVVKNDSNVIAIYGKTALAVKEARKFLEKDEVTIQVPNHTVGTIIGKCGINIRQLQQSKETKIKCIKAENPDYSIFKIVGSPENIREVEKLIRVTYLGNQL